MATWWQDTQWFHSVGNPLIYIYTLHSKSVSSPVVCGRGSRQMIVYEAKWGNNKKPLFRSRSVRSAPVPPFYTAKNQCISYLIQKGERKYFLDTVYIYFEGKKTDRRCSNNLRQSLKTYFFFKLQFKTWVGDSLHSYRSDSEFLQDYKQLSFLSHRTRLH